MHKCTLLLVCPSEHLWDSVGSICSILFKWLPRDATLYCMCAFSSPSHKWWSTFLLQVHQKYCTCYSVACVILHNNRPYLWWGILLLFAAGFACVSVEALPSVLLHERFGEWHCRNVMVCVNVHGWVQKYAQLCAVKAGWMTHLSVVIAPCCSKFCELWKELQ